MSANVVLCVHAHRVNTSRATTLIVRSGRSIADASVRKYGTFASNVLAETVWSVYHA